MKEKLELKADEAYMLVFASDAVKVERYPISELMIQEQDLLFSYGQLYTKAEAAAIAGVSHQRICKLVIAKRLRTVAIDLVGPKRVVKGIPKVSGDDLHEWLNSPRKTGRPRSQASPVRAKVVAA